MKTRRTTSKQRLARKKHTFTPYFEQLEARELLSCTRVVLDAGHGGTANVGGSSWNNATSVSGILEKDLTLQMSQLVKTNLEARGFDVTLTRSTDVNLSLADRARTAARLAGDQEHVFFLSIHYNGFNDPRARGTETFIRQDGNVNADEDRILADAVQRSVYSAWQPTGGRDRGVKTANWGVLSDISQGNTHDEHPVVSALLEVEFITNPDVDALLNQTYQQFVAAAAIGQGIERARDQLCNSPSIVEVIDRSGSMSGDKLAGAKNAASVFVDLMDQGDKLGVVSYSSTASTDFPLTEITDDSIKNQAKSAINSLVATGATSIGAGVQAADAQLDRFPEDAARAMIVMTDGLQNTAPEPLSVINSQVDDDIRVFTIGFGTDADTSFLTQMAALRNGQYFFAANNAQLQQIYTQLVGQLSQDLTLLNLDGNIQAGEQSTNNFDVDASVTTATVGVNYGGSDLDLELVAPDGTVITHATAANDPDIELIEGPTFEFLKLRLPMDGPWQVRVIAVDVPPEGEPYNLFVTADSSLTATLETVDPSTGGRKLELETGEAIDMRLTLHDFAPIINASAEMIVTPPSGPPVPLPLYDDGAHHDAAAGDGIYANTFDRAFLPGVYDVDVQSSGTATPGFGFEIVNSASFVATGGPIDPVQSIGIDVKPGSDSNPINVQGNGVIPVAIVSSDSFDATTVDTSSVLFAGASPVHSSLEDVDGDGDLDVVLHFRLHDTHLVNTYAGLLADADSVNDGHLDPGIRSRQTMSVSLTGETVSGDAFEGFDEVELFLSGRAFREMLDELALAGLI